MTSTTTEDVEFSDQELADIDTLLKDFDQDHASTEANPFIDMPFQELIKTYLASAGGSTRHLSLLSNIRRPRIEKILSGKKVPTEQEVEILCIAIGKYSMTPKAQTKKAKLATTTPQFVHPAASLVEQAFPRIPTTA